MQVVSAVLVWGRRSGSQVHEGRMGGGGVLELSWSWKGRRERNRGRG